MKNDGYLLGVFWFILSLISSAINDVIAKYLVSDLTSYQITFFRFLFGSITLVPFIFAYGIGTIKTSRPFVHFMRGLLLFLGMSGWVYGLKLSTVTTATVVSFTVPIFVLVLGFFFLKENVIWQRWFVTILVFLGLIFTLDLYEGFFNPKILIFILATIAFASLDIINKKFIVKESMISMLFYSALITAVLAFPFALEDWKMPNYHQTALLFALGGGANLILFFILKAFATVDATALAPYRYIELLISATMSYLVFSEQISVNTIYGALIIIPSTLFIIYSEKWNIKNNKQKNL